MDKVLDKGVLREIERESKLDGFIMPHYRGYCLSNLSASILSHFNSGIEGHPAVPKEILAEHLEGAEKIILLLVDALGYDFLRRNSTKAFQELTDRGVMVPLTSTFPSTTTTALATLYTGLTPQEHSLIGYTMYLKEIGLVANMVDFAPSAGYEEDALIKMGLNPSTFLRKKTIHSLLSKVGVKSCVITRRFYRETPLTKMLLGNASLETYVDTPDLFILIRRILENSEGEICLFPYWDGIDTAAHIYGPSGEEATAVLENLSFCIKTQLLDKVDRKVAKKTVFIITGDHGQIDTRPETYIMLLNHPRLLSYLQVPPTGDSRASYLYVKPRMVEAAKDYLKSKFGEKLLVLDSESALQDGLFGIGRVDRMMRDRIGDLTVLPRESYTFTYPYKQRQRRFNLRGAHGGLSREEALVPLLCSKLA